MFGEGGFMKKLFILFGILGLFSLPSMAFDPYGIVYQNTVQPLVGSGSVNTAKVGKAKARSFFGIVAIGDCSIKSAMTNGKIKNLSHADQHIKCILGVRTLETRAYGQ